MGHMVLPLIDFNCQNLHKFIYKLSEHVTASISTVVERDWYHPELGGYVQLQIDVAHDDSMYL